MTETSDNSKKNKNSTAKRAGREVRPGSGNINNKNEKQ